MADKLNDVIEAEATVEESGTPAQLGTAFQWLAVAEAKVEKALADKLYAKPDIKSADDYKLAKQHRKQIRAIIKDINDQKISYTKEIKRIVRDFELRTNGICDPLSTLDEEYKESITAWEEYLRQEKMQQLEERLFECVPALSGILSFEVFKRRFDEGWDKLTYKTGKALEDVEKAAGLIEKEYASIDAMGLSEDDRKELQSDYIATLDMNEALRKNAERQERKRRLAEIEAENERRKQEAEARAKAQEEAKAQAEAEAAEQAPEPTPEPVQQPEPIQEPAETPEAAPELAYTLYIQSGKASDWNLAINTILMLEGALSINTVLTKEQVAHLVKVLKDNGIKGNLRRI